LEAFEIPGLLGLAGEMRVHIHQAGQNEFLFQIDHVVARLSVGETRFECGDLSFLDDHRDIAARRLGYAIDQRARVNERALRMGCHCCQPTTNKDPASQTMQKMSHAILPPSSNRMN